MDPFNIDRCTHSTYTSTRMKMLPYYWLIFNVYLGVVASAIFCRNVVNGTGTYMNVWLKCSIFLAKEINYVEEIRDILPLAWCDVAVTVVRVRVTWCDLEWVYKWVTSSSRFNSCYVTLITLLIISRQRLKHNLSQKCTKLTNTHRNTHVFEANRFREGLISFTVDLTPAFIQ